MSQSIVCNSTTDECSAPITALAARPIDASGQIAVPGRFGVFGLGDVGRVFYDQDPDGADTWHTGVGGGIWMSFIQQQHTLSVAVANGDDLTGLYVRAGFLF